jgi:dipeptidyl aminopeptidase/acylaminoacyl peptidase
VASFPEDVNLVLKFLKSEYSILPESTFIVGEGLGGYLALNASTSENESFNGVIVNRINFPGKEFSQDLLAARMFGEDAQAKWATLDRTSLSPKTFYLSYSSDKSKTEVAFENSMKANNIKWTAHSADIVNKSASSKDLDGIIIWLKHLSQIETQVFEVKPNVEVKKK